MSAGSCIKNIALSAVFGLVALGIGVAVTSVDQAVHPASQGIEYLQSQGYKNVSGGEDPHYFNTCSRNTMSREYTVQGANGKTDTKAVCFGTFGPYRPFFGP